MKTDVNFKGLLSDLEFKFLFSHEEILKDFIDSYYNYIDVNKYVTFSKVALQHYILPNKKHLKGYFGDVVCTLNDGEIIILEAYTQFNYNESIKSSCYLARLYSNQLSMKKKNYSSVKKVTILNLVTNNYKKCNNNILNNYTLINNKTYSLFNNGEMEYVIVRLDLSNKIEYNLIEERFVKWLKFLNAKTFKELETIGKDDKILEQSIEYIKSYCGSEDDHNFGDILAYHELCARDDGKMEEKLETAKNMLKKNISINDIKDITALTKKEIINLQKEL